MADEIEPVERELEPPWGRHADIEFVVSMVSPSRGPAVGKWLQSLRVRSEDRGRRAFRAATETAGVSADELLETIMADERLTDLFRMAMELAARTGDEQKLQALGRVLASGALADDDAEYDEAPLLMRTIGQLEPADVRVLSAAPVGSFTRAHGSPDAVWVHLEQLGLIEKIPGTYPSSGDSGDEVIQHYQLSAYGKRILTALLTSVDEEASEDDGGL